MPKDTPKKLVESLLKEHCKSGDIVTVDKYVLTTLPPQARDAETWTVLYKKRNGWVLCHPTGIPEYHAEFDDHNLHLVTQKPQWPVEQRDFNPDDDLDDTIP